MLTKWVKRMRSASFDPHCKCKNISFSMGNPELNISKNNEGSYDNKSMGYERFNNESKKKCPKALSFYALQL